MKKFTTAYQRSFTKDFLEEYDSILVRRGKPVNVHASDMILVPYLFKAIRKSGKRYGILAHDLPLPLAALKQIIVLHKLWLIKEMSRSDLTYETGLIVQNWFWLV